MMKVFIHNVVRRTHKQTFSLPSYGKSENASLHLFAGHLLL